MYLLLPLDASEETPHPDSIFTALHAGARFMVSSEQNTSSTDARTPFTSVPQQSSLSENVEVSDNDVEVSDNDVEVSDNDVEVSENDDIY